MFDVQRFGVIMAGNPDDPREAWGVLNPAAARGRDGELFLFPRVVAANNYSRIGIAKVVFANDVPVAVERMGYALEPSDGYEVNDHTGGGVEDPRITFVAPLNRYIMTYTAYGPTGPRIALAVSDDLFTWERLGLLKFMYVRQRGTDFDLYPNKDAFFFPEAIADPNGQPALAMIHRPSYELWRLNQTPRSVVPRGVAEPRPSMWISYVPLASVLRDIHSLAIFDNHTLLATPQHPWEQLKVGGGTPPVRTHLGWFLVHHGVSGVLIAQLDLQPDVHYSAGVMILDADDPTKMVYRSAEPIMEPESNEERQGIVPNVVFPTGVDVRNERQIDVYYGMADSRIGAARITLPDQLPMTNDQ